jgi:anti-repressor protein
MIYLLKFKDSQIRVLILDGEPWFVAIDIAEVLGYDYFPHMLDLLDKRDKRIENPQKLNCTQIHQAFNSNTFTISLINEVGIYDCIFNSTMSEIREFKKWITSEVLPTLHKKENNKENIQLKEILDQVTASNQILIANKKQTEELMLKIDSLTEENAGLKFILKNYHKLLSSN